MEEVITIPRIYIDNSYQQTIVELNFLLIPPLRLIVCSYLQQALVPIRQKVLSVTPRAFLFRENEDYPMINKGTIWHDVFTDKSLLIPSPLLHLGWYEKPNGNMWKAPEFTNGYTITCTKMELCIQDRKGIKTYIKNQHFHWAFLSSVFVSDSFIIIVRVAWYPEREVLRFDRKTNLTTSLGLYPIEQTSSCTCIRHLFLVHNSDELIIYEIGPKTLELRKRVPMKGRMIMGTGNDNTLWTIYDKTLCQWDLIYSEKETEIARKNE